MDNNTFFVQYLRQKIEDFVKVNQIRVAIISKNQTLSRKMSSLFGVKPKDGKKKITNAIISSFP
jgi:hypothetical protein